MNETRFKSQDERFAFHYYISPLLYHYYYYLQRKKRVKSGTGTKLFNIKERMKLI